MKIPEEKELLELLDKERNMAWAWLLRKGIIKEYKEPQPTELVIESLTDLAERLWKLAVEKCYGQLQDVCESERMFPFLSGKMSYYTTWLFDSKLIYRIVASLIALKRAGVEI